MWPQRYQEGNHLSVCRLNRASQTYSFPIHLTDQLLPSAVFYATVGPLVFYLAMQRLVIRPYMRAQKEQWEKLHSKFLFRARILIGSLTKCYYEHVLSLCHYFIYLWIEQGIREAAGEHSLRHSQEKTGSRSCCEYLTSRTAFWFRIRWEMQVM